MLTKQAGAYTGELVRLGARGPRIPSVEIEVLDSLGATSTTVRLRDVAVISDRVTLASSRTALEQQRIAQQEALSALTADQQEAQRQLATTEELGKSRVGTRLDLARARDRVADLQRRIGLLERRQALVTAQLANQGPLEERIVLRFGWLEIEQSDASGPVAIDLSARGLKRP
jgi:hypothetical protein